MIYSHFDLGLSDLSPSRFGAHDTRLVGIRIHSRLVDITVLSDSIALVVDTTALPLRSSLARRGRQNLSPILRTVDRRRGRTRGMSLQGLVQSTVIENSNAYRIHYEIATPFRIESRYLESLIIRQGLSLHHSKRDSSILRSTRVGDNVPNLGNGATIVSESRLSMVTSRNVRRRIDLNNRTTSRRIRSKNYHVVYKIAVKHFSPSCVVMLDRGRRYWRRSGVDRDK
nr:MAG TPA: hypothetical protein [Caudoviricetes sp.]